MKDNINNEESLENYGLNLLIIL